MDTTATSGATTTPRFTPGESLGSGRVVQVINTDVNPAVGRGTRALIGQSIYLLKGSLFTQNHKRQSLANTQMHLMWM